VTTVTRSAARRDDAPAVGAPRASRAYAPLVGLTSLAILAQSLMAGVFLQSDHRDDHQSWIDAHGIGADVTTLVALASAVVAFRAFRHRTDLVAGSAALFVLLLAETGLGQLINGSIGSSEHPGLTVVHIPLGMALLGLTVWLAVGVASGRRAGNL